MDARFILLTCMAAAGGFGIATVAMRGLPQFEMPSFDPAEFSLSREQAQSILSDALTTIPRRDGDGQIRIWSTGRSSEGVMLSMQYMKGAPTLSCEAVITKVSATRTRVAPDCAPRAGSDSAIARTQDQLHVPMFEEHIQATLEKRAFNRKAVDQAQSAAVFSNLGAMQREGLERAAEDARFRRELERR